MNPIELYVNSRYQTDQSRAEAVQFMRKVGERSGLDLAAEAVATAYGIEWEKRVAQRGPKAGQTVYIFGDGRYEISKTADAARKTFSRLRNEAWPP